MNNRLLGLNLLVFAGVFTFLFIIYTLSMNSYLSDTEMALIVLGIILVMIGGVLIVNSGNSSGRITYRKMNVSRNFGKNIKVKRR